MTPGLSQHDSTSSKDILAALLDDIFYPAGDIDFALPAKTPVACWQPPITDRRSASKVTHHHGSTPELDFSYVAVFAFVQSLWFKDS